MGSVISIAPSYELQGGTGKDVKCEALGGLISKFVRPIAGRKLEFIKLAKQIASRILFSKALLSRNGCEIDTDYRDLDLSSLNNGVRKGSVKTTRVSSACSIITILKPPPCVFSPVTNCSCSGGQLEPKEDRKHLFCPPLELLCSKGQELCQSSKKERRQGSVSYNNYILHLEF
ncbi:hypothetical protein OIU84_009344 [Salix udensis]|uniref:Uncharacterized protein n=1 Tax=Salix udensis TaxID=889485 RepID=A0AAD6JRA5_9ROSI|nr:hypothetical protein OIU84_009344 [Salix udensis]